MKILLSSICLETGTDIQLALYYLKYYIFKLKPKDNIQETVYSRMIELMSGAIQSRRIIGALVREKILKFEWIMIMNLLFAVLFSILIINDGSFLSIIISFLLIKREL